MSCAVRYCNIFRRITNEKDNNKVKDNRSHFWTFVQIKYEKKYEGRNKKVIIEPACGIALQVGNKFYLHNLKSITKSKTNTKHIQILERFDCIPYGASQELIDYYKEHLRKDQIKQTK